MQQDRFLLRGRLVRSAALCVLLPVWAVQAKPTYVTFEVPSAGTHKFQGTFAYRINDADEVAGIYYDNNDVVHGFVRAPDGTVATFDPAGSVYTHIGAISDNGTITGEFRDAGHVYHGFVRTQDGAISVFDLSGQIDSSSAINSKDTVTGNFAADGAFHGFTRTSSGRTRTFDPPDSTGTYPYGINTKGAVTGIFFLGSVTPHAFLRSQKGDFTAFDASGSVHGTYALSINAKGEIAGYFYDTDFVDHAFVRSADGLITNFDVPGSAEGTSAYSINAKGTIVGAYGANSNHGFTRSRVGAIKRFDVPGIPHDTYPGEINLGGAVVGHYTDNHGVEHGFLRSP
jgi:uncharacterized membrane protein